MKAKLKKADPYNNDNDKYSVSFTDLAGEDKYSVSFTDLAGEDNYSVASQTWQVRTSTLLGPQT